MIALPANDTQWPPISVAKRYARFPLLGAWYAGDPDQLSGAHGAVQTVMTGGPGTTINPNGSAPHAQYVSRQRFWTTGVSEEVNTKRHLPLPEDIARIVAKSLYSEPGTVKVQGPVYPEDAPQDADGTRAYHRGDPMPETVAAQKRLDTILAKCNWEAVLLAAAEIGSAMGSYGLRVAYDKAAGMTMPVITRQDADATIPLYEWGQLVGVIFWRVVQQDKGNTVWRHLELHSQGAVWHGLYKGDAGNIGKRRPLEENAATAGLASVVDAEGKVTILANPLGKTAVSIPNMLPDPLDRSNNAGRSDYTPSMIDLFESVDRVFSQMMDEVDDARSRILIAKSLLQNNGPGQGVSINLAQRVFTKVNLPPSEKEGSMPIEQIQFEMRVEQYLTLINAITAKAIDTAGYQADSSTSDDGKVMTATEFDGRDRGNRSTRDQRIRYAQNELSDLLTGLLQVDVEVFASRDPLTGQRIQAYPVVYEFPEAVQPTVLQLTEVAKALKDSGAADLVERVRALHPDWNEGKIRDQAEKIKAENTAVDPTTFGLGGQFL